MTVNWKQVWEKKGLLTGADLIHLDGFENTNISPSFVCDSIKKIINYREGESVLEVGCGAGMIAQHFSSKYIGVDYSESLVKKHKEILGNEVYVSEANNLKFPNNQFEHTICFSVFQYFPDMSYAKEVIDEMLRVSKGSVFIGDLPMSSHEKSHLLFNKEDFIDWHITEGFYNKDRFNVYKRGNY